MRIPLRLIFLCPFCLALSAFAQNVVINEFMSSNEGVVLDEDGDFEDWVELYNADQVAVNLLGFGLTDSPSEPMPWLFPSYVMQPGEYLLVFCSGKNRISGPYFHTNFKLKNEGEPIQLLASSGDLLDAVAPIALATNFSYGYLFDGSGYRERFDGATPGFANASVQTVRFSHQSGAYANSVSLALMSSLPAEIRFTTDGSLPSAESSLYVGPIELASGGAGAPVLSQISTSFSWIPPTVQVEKIHTIRAQAFVDGVAVSKVYSKTYFVGDILTEELAMYPVVSIQVNASDFFDHDTGIYVPGANFNPSNQEWTGNFFQRGIAWERDVHLEYFEQGELRWAQDAGVRIHGGKTRNAPQKSLRLYAREAHGAHKFNYPIFETKDKRVFDKLILHGHFGCWNKTMIKDALSAYIARDLDFDSQHAQPALVFINGEFWGVQTFRDHFDDNYFEETYDVEAEDVSLILHGSGTNPNHDENWGVLTGSNAHYLALLDFIENHDLSEFANYTYVTTQLDVSSMIDFFCTAIYFNQYDWPSNNHKVWRGADDSKWRWMMYDFDSAWGYKDVSFDLLSYAAHPTGTSIYNTPYTTFLFRNLLTSPVFRQQFLERYACLMNTDFAPDVVEAAIDRFVDWYAPVFPAHRDRWNNLNSFASWSNLVSTKLYAFNAGRRAQAVAHVSAYFGFEFDIDAYSCEPSVGMQEPQRDAESLQVYPNPASSYVYVDDAFAGANAVLEVFDLNGRMVSSVPFEHHMKLSVDQLPRGLYLLSLIELGTRKTSKLVVE